jgi:hypothetical protein
MTTLQLHRLAKHVTSKLRILGFSSPTTSVMRALLDISYIASITTEENQFIRGALTYSDPKAPDLTPPRLRRADYPSFAAFRRRIPLDAKVLVKLCRAVDRWSGSIAVYGTNRRSLFVWGVVDQMVQRNIRLNREAKSGFAAPGIVTVYVDGVGDISVYHGDLFLGRLRQNDVIMRESDVLHSSLIARRVAPALTPAAKSIALALGKPDEYRKMLRSLLDAWADVVARICIGLRRLGTGGTILITPTPIPSMLDVVHPIRYRRLGDSAILNVLDGRYFNDLEWADNDEHQNTVEVDFARADAQDREDELTGAVKLVTSLAAADGLVLMDSSLAVEGFGVKIKAGGRVNTVYDGGDFARKGTSARRIIMSRFGTRHGSMLRYCKADRNAIGVVLSQDGHARIIASLGRSLTMWENVKLLGHEHDVGAYARALRRKRLRRSKVPQRQSLGYTSMPKTIRQLLSYRKGVGS